MKTFQLAIQKVVISLIPIVFRIPTLFGQDAVPAAGGEAIGTTGTVSYTIGQVVYSTQEDQFASVAQGVQQPYEISIVIGLEEAEGIQLQAIAYPNPTRGRLTLRIENYDYQDLEYQVYDLTGKLLNRQRISSNEERISLVDFSSGIYLLKVCSPKKELKTFRIIRH